MKFGQVTNLDSIEFDLPEIPNRTKELLNKSTTEKIVKFYPMCQETLIQRTQHLQQYSPGERPNCNSDTKDK